MDAYAFLLLLNSTRFQCLLTWTGFAYDEATQALQVLTVRALGPSHGLYSGKAVDRLRAVKGTPLPPLEQCILRLAWHPTYGAGQASHAGGRLATGLACGVVRLQTIYVH